MKASSEAGAAVRGDLAPVKHARGTGRRCDDGRVESGERAAGSVELVALDNRDLVGRLDHLVGIENHGDGERVPVTEHHCRLRGENGWGGRLLGTRSARTRGCFVGLLVLAFSVAVGTVLFGERDGGDNGSRTRGATRCGGRRGTLATGAAQNGLAAALPVVTAPAQRVRAAELGLVKASGAARAFRGAAVGAVAAREQRPRPLEDDRQRRYASRVTRKVCERTKGGRGRGRGARAGLQR
tara:strand:+ start:373 stop:1092 length:720 start_codon:yes stop_codon:yes gene_type:complete